MRGIATGVDHRHDRKSNPFCSRGHAKAGNTMADGRCLTCRRKAWAKANRVQARKCNRVPRKPVSGWEAILRSHNLGMSAGLASWLIYWHDLERCAAIPSLVTRGY
jgi:hypothetical protein